MILALALKALSFGKGVLSPLVALWRYLTADWHRMAFAVLITLCGFLGWRLHTVDASRDDWRDKAESYEVAAKALAEASKVAGMIGIETAAQTKGEVDARIERAKQAGADSPDPLGDTVRCLRAEADCGRD